MTDSQLDSEESQIELPSRSKANFLISWLATSVTLAAYFGLMITVSLAPQLLTQPITPGSAITTGVALGAAIIIFLIVVAALFTRWNNKLDERL